MDQFIKYVGLDTLTRIRLPLRSLMLWAESLGFTVRLRTRPERCRNC